MVVATFEMTWYLWLAKPNAGLDAPAEGPFAAMFSTLLAITTVASFAYFLITGWTVSQKAMPQDHAATTAAPPTHE
jgi:hypothetical protein